MRTELTLSTHDIQMLVPVRLALEAALVQARAAGPYRRGAALVALDAVVERATDLCASARGLQVSVKLEDTISRLRGDHEFDWTPKVLPAVRLLRKARNSAQHDGIEPDRDFVPLAATTTEVFVVELLEAQYGVDVRTVTLSQAITDTALRGVFARAEEARERGNFHECIQLAISVYSDALRKWNSIRSRRPTFFRADKLGREADESLTALETTLNAATFVADVGAAEWFAALRRDANYDVFDDVDAARALAFAFSWITGYESAAATWTHNRWLTTATKARRVRSGEARAEIASATAALVAPDSGMISATFVIENVPPSDEYAAWARALREQLTDASRRDCWVDNDGTVKITRPVSESTLFAEDTEALAAALQAVEERFATQRLHEREAAEQRTVQSQRMTNAVVAARGQWPAWVLGVEWNASVSDATTWRLRLDPAVHRLQLLEEENAPQFGIQELLGKQPGVEECPYTTGDDILLSPAGSVDNLLRVLRGADPVVAAALRRGQEALDREKATLLDVNSSLAVAVLRTATRTVA
ncbi:hypothetical protein [Microbacterium esteraromaticum]|uniref:hypothetical protein n=1 Tax=Microbacterium esteraromaticum TaxID=57043 RepID=UPI0019D4105F|nr:hypothetical protein [Microbacterium esteraromaticum]MBN7794641.1 hypothetical protein [Microbacterium esteraromaticum]